MALTAAQISSLIGGGSALGSFAGNILGSAMSFHRQKQLMEHQAFLNYDYGAKTALNAPTWNRKGLESAGYNPMLAVQNATSGVNSNFAAQSTANEPDYGSSIGSAVANATDVARLNNETQSTEANADLAYANADKAKVEKASLLEKLPFISKREQSSINNLDKDSLLKESQIHNIDETTRFIEKRFELDRLLGEMGINTQRYGIDKNYNASTYATSVNALNNMRDNRTKTTIEHINHPISSYFHKGYTSGKNNGVSRANFYRSNSSFYKNSGW